jgi:hypothetical protein
LRLGDVVGVERETFLLGVWFGGLWVEEGKNEVEARFRSLDLLIRLFGLSLLHDFGRKVPVKEIVMT